MSDDVEFENDTNNVAAMMAEATAEDDPEEASKKMEEATKEGSRQAIKAYAFIIALCIFCILMWVWAVNKFLG